MWLLFVVAADGGTSGYVSLQNPLTAAIPPVYSGRLRSPCGEANGRAARGTSHGGRRRGDPQVPGPLERLDRRVLGLTHGGLVLRRLLRLERNLDLVARGDHRCRHRRFVLGNHGLEVRTELLVPAAREELNPPRADRLVLLKEIADGLRRLVSVLEGRQRVEVEVEGGSKISSAGTHQGPHWRCPRWACTEPR